MTEAGGRDWVRERFYDSIATEFDARMNRFDLERRLGVVERLVVASALPAASLVLDLGAGTGPFSLAAQRRGHHVVSVDIGVRLLGVARTKGAALPVGADALRLPFPDETFDAVISSECIEHTPDPRRAVAEALRVVKRGGHLVLTCPNRAWHWAAVAASKLRLRAYQGLENWPTWHELDLWVAEAGGEVMSHEGLHALPFNLPGAAAILPTLDRLGRRFERRFVNQCIRARRR